MSSQPFDNEPPDALAELAAIRDCESLNPLIRVAASVWIDAARVMKKEGAERGECPKSS
jgi:hypothetical protein